MSPIEPFDNMIERREAEESAKVLVPRAPTPAIKRAAEALSYQMHMMSRATPPTFEDEAYEALTAALTDPDDPDSLARTLFVLHHEASGWIVGAHVFDASPARNQWRKMADGLRTVLTGSAA